MKDEFRKSLDRSFEQNTTSEGDQSSPVDAYCPVSNPAAYSDMYNRLYPAFPMQSKMAGSFGINVLQIDQNSHQTSDPGVDDIVFRLVSDSAMTHSSVDIGDGRKTLSGAKGSFYLAPDNAIADWRADGRHSLMMLAVPKSKIAELLEQDEMDQEGDPFRSLYGHDIFDPAVSNYMELIHKHSKVDQAGNTLLIDGLFMAMLGTLMGLDHKTTMDGETRQEAPLDAARLSRVIEYIDANLHRPITVVELAGIACLSPYHFSRCFRAATNSSPHRFLITRRTDAAKRMLVETSESLAQIAHACGFSSQSHFTTLFKAATGQPPGAYRTQMRP